MGIFGFNHPAPTIKKLLEVAATSAPVHSYFDIIVILDDSKSTIEQRTVSARVEPNNRPENLQSINLSKLIAVESAIKSLIEVYQIREKPIDTISAISVGDCTTESYGSFHSCANELVKLAANDKVFRAFLLNKDAVVSVYVDNEKQSYVVHILLQHK